MDNRLRIEILPTAHHKEFNVLLVNTTYVDCYNDDLDLDGTENALLSEENVHLSDLNKVVNLFLHRTDNLTTAERVK